MSHLEGRAWKFGDYISTDAIAPGRYFHLRSNLDELAKHVLEDANPEFARNVRQGDMVVAGKNFGMGSSREHAPVIMKLAGVSAVIAVSFARIFFRNAVNIGLPAITVPNVDFVADGDRLRVDLARGELVNVTQGRVGRFSPLPPFMLAILDGGGVIETVIRDRGFKI